jgi:hypothetical protein
MLKTGNDRKDKEIKGIHGSKRKEIKERKR